ncbi:von Willebrand factor A domain-containing protein 7 isoform X3 [Acinonyx jubatus]|uniref:von Willebrand factor A domain-containing protein 7 isoform X3 n=1 Tax=Acinonyx jubatus TaxID=32536 RepID=A0ABM3Q503_ACIJB|nr:von Willebrand factor A domain-containing protein 7 isoform X3 [Acinonyx jubatus]XP_053079000.1 von Willebrand factor A domain-containing protein 7 isoform X3 [Acinonyx jubatus]
MLPADVPLAHLNPSLLLLLLLQLLPPATSFFPNIWSLLAAPGSVTHQDLTEEAALNVTLQLFLEQPPPGRPPLRLEDFLGHTLLADNLFAAYFGPGSPSRRFRAALGEVSRANAAQDFLPTSRNDPDLHFDAERLGQGRTRLVGALREALVAARALDHTLARQRLGAALHALQDFYSHSNWVELGQQQPHPHLLWPRQELRSLAQVDDPTCSDCEELSCPGNLLGFTLLTSGYFGTHPSKPPGKCSHGGRFDQSSSQPPRGGINKDSTSPGFSPHHMLHLQAAKLALLASIQALSLLRNRLGDRGFSRLLDISPASSLSFVLDTTGSMGEEINAAKIQVRHIVEQRRGSPMEPVHYILVPFHDPGFGPVFTTSDPDSFWQQLNEIHALGGGDEPEMCLSALELALLHTPPLSDIFVFTDASPKDAFLTNRVESLTQERRCRVTFLVTEDPSRVQGRARREVLSPLRFEPYEAVALASGGEVIFTKDQHIQDVAAVVGDSMADLVTLPLEPPVVVSGRPLVFSVDALLQRVTIRIHGEVSSFWIRNPAGVSQGQEEGEGPLGHTRRFGQFWIVTISDPPQTGTWEILVTAESTPRVRVQERSLIALALLSPDIPGLPLLLWDPCGGWPPPWPLPPDSASCRPPDPAAGRGDRAGLQRQPWSSSAAFLSRRPTRGPGRCRAGPGAFGAHGTAGARFPRRLTTVRTSVHCGTFLSGVDWPGRRGAEPAPSCSPALHRGPCPSGAQRLPGIPGSRQQGPAQPPHRQLLGPSGSRS